MKIAVAGTGAVARYLIEELNTHGHEVLVLTRTTKNFLQEQGVKQKETDYSVDSLREVLNNCDGLVSTINNIIYPNSAVDIHLNMLEACRRSEKCKRFLPSEWTGNVEEHPDQPMWEDHHNNALYDKLRSQSEVKWSIICVSWFADYVLPRRQRYHEDIDQLWPMDYSAKTFTIYGSGTQLVNFVSTRDTAKAVAILFDHPGEWEPYTYVSGDLLTWNDLFALIKKSNPEYTSKPKSLAETVRQIVAKESEMSVLAAYFELLSYANASKFPDGAVERQQGKYFSGMHFRSVEEILNAGTVDPEKII